MLDVEFCRGRTDVVESQIGRRLRAARALALVAAQDVRAAPLRRELQRLASEIESDFDRYLDFVILQRGDVELRFQMLRELYPAWPRRIPSESWERLVRTRYLSDLTDVICDGGGFWEAIDAALLEEFAATAP
jgi:hypothetical protein